jgi:hypothetical protein
MLILGILSIKTQAFATKIPLFFLGCHSEKICSKKIINIDAQE